MAEVENNLLAEAEEIINSHEEMMSETIPELGEDWEEVDATWEGQFEEILSSCDDDGVTEEIEENLQDGELMAIFDLDFPKDQVDITRTDVVTGRVHEKLNYINASYEIERNALEFKVKQYSEYASATKLYSAVATIVSGALYFGGEETLGLCALAVAGAGFLISRRHKVVCGDYKECLKHLELRENIVKEIEETLVRNGL